MALLEAALELAGMGYPVLALRPGGKTPLVLPHLGLRRGLKDATLDPERIRAWWAASPEANLGVVPPAEGLVLDLDGENAAFALFLAYPDLLKAPRAVTGSGGLHLWLRLPPAWSHRLAPRARALPQWGLDLRGLGRSYLVAPPSVHPSRRRYAWVLPLVPPGRLPVAPKGLLEALTPPAPSFPAQGFPGKVPKGGQGEGRERAYALAELRGRAEEMARTPPGARHTELVRHAVALWAWVREGVLREEELGVLWQAALASGLPPEEVDGVVRWLPQTAPVRSKPPL